MTRTGIEMTGTSGKAATLAATSEGEGQTVVLLHGTASSSAIWQPMRAALSAERQTVAVDLRGHGASPGWRAGERPTLAAEAAAVAAIAVRGGGPVHLVGHSYGGAVALRLAATMPQRIASLTLIEPAAFQLLVGRDGKDRALLDQIRAVADALREPQSGVAGFVDYWNGDGFWASLRPERQAALIALAPTIRANFEAIFQDPMRLPDCAALGVPTLLMAGERSTRLARRVASLLGSAMPWARARLVCGAGHMIPRSHPVTVLHAIRAHLARVADDPAPARRPIAA